MAGHGARCDDVMYGCHEHRGRLGPVIICLQEVACVSSPHDRPRLIKTCDVAVVDIDQAADVENSVTDFKGRRLSLSPLPEKVRCKQAVQIFKSGAGTVRGKVELVGYFSRDSPYLCDCIGVLQDDGGSMHGPRGSGLLLTTVPTEGTDVVDCLAMLIALQTIEWKGKPLREYSIAVPMRRLFRRLQGHWLFSASDPLCFVGPLAKPRRSSSPVLGLDLQEMEADGEVTCNVGDLSSVATPSHV